MIAVLIFSAGSYGTLSAACEWTHRACSHVMPAGSPHSCTRRRCITQHVHLPRNHLDLSTDNNPALGNAIRRVTSTQLTICFISSIAGHDQVIPRYQPRKLLSSAMLHASCAMAKIFEVTASHGKMVRLQLSDLLC
jgi:hypothetical protein